MSATNSSRSPGSASIRSAIFANSAGLKFLAIGEASVPPSSTLNQASPLAPKSCMTKFVSSSMSLREYWAAAPLALMPRTRPPASAAARNTRNSVSLRQVGDVDQLHAEPQVGRVVPKPLHRLVVRHARQRQLDVLAQDLLGQSRHQPVDQADDVVAVDERHFQVELRELGLAVGSQVFVAKAAGHLHVAIVAGDHQDLLVKLRRLRQRVEIAVVHAAGHQIIAGPFGRAAAEHRRFDVDETVLVEKRAHAANDPMPQEHRGLLLRPPQIEIAIFQPQVFARQFLGRRAETAA